MKTVVKKLIVPIIMIAIMVLPVCAAGSAKVMAAHTIDDHIQIYVRDGSASGEVQYQIDNVKVDTIQARSISEDKDGIQTLIMLDNSMSIPKDSRPKTIEAINAIIDAHAEGERFRIATFSDGINYLSDSFSDDYTGLHNMINSIEFNDQDTMLTDVLYDVIGEYNSSEYKGYSRIIIITDGVNNKPVGGVTLDRIKEVLKETPYPIYTVGCNTGKNDDLLDNLFSLSWMTGCEYVVLEDSEVTDITSMTSADNNMTVYDATIPVEAQTGGKHSSKLTLSDGTELVFDVTVPFSVKAEEEEPVKPDDTTPIIDTTDNTGNEPVVEEKDNNLLIPIIIACVSVIVVAGIAILLVLKRKKKNRTSSTDNTSEKSDSGKYEKTEYLGKGNDKHTDTQLLTPGGSGSDVKRYQFNLSDTNDLSRSFRCELVTEISIGRRPDNTIVITDDTAVHGYHCKVTSKDGVFYISDLKDVKNHTSVNGSELKPEIPQLIVSNSNVTIGRHTYSISIKEV